MASTDTVKMDRSSLGLRNALFDTLDDLRNGKCTPQKASAVASITSQIVSVTKLELNYQRFVASSKTGDESAKTVPHLSLGS